MHAGVARSLGLPRSLGPHVGAIFEGLDNLGSSPAVIVSMARRALYGPGRVLDLACGKGGVAVALAERLGCSVVGVDACDSFIQSAKALARAKGVGRRCRFRVGDVREFQGGTFDLAIMLGLFGVEQAAPLLRRQVKPGGVYLLDDAFRDERRARGGSPRAMGKRNGGADPLQECHLGVPTLGECRAVFERLGDEVVEEGVPSRRTMRALNGGLYEMIERNVRRLAEREPMLSRPLEEFLARQREGNALLVGPIRPGVWVVRRGS